MGEALVPEEEMCGGSSRGVRGVVPEDIQIHIGQEIRYGRTCTVGKNAVLEPWVVSGRVCLVSIGVGGGMEVDGVASVAMGEAAGEAAVVLAWPVRMGNGLGSLG